MTGSDVICGVGLCVCTPHSFTVCLLETPAPERGVCCSVKERRVRASLSARGTSCEVAAGQDGAGKTSCAAHVTHAVFWQAMTFRIPAALWMAILT